MFDYKPTSLDPAVLRPGRLDKILYVGFPGPQDRVQILQAITKNGAKPKLGRTYMLKFSKVLFLGGGVVVTLLNPSNALDLKKNVHICYYLFTTLTLYLVHWFAFF